MPHQASGSQAASGSSTGQSTPSMRLDGGYLSIGVAVFVLGVAFVLLQRPFALSERGDLAIWDYIAQSILRGKVPYRDVIEIKTPLAAYLSAASMAAGRAIGLHDVFAARMLSVLMIGILSVATYLVAVVNLRNRLAAFIAFLIPLLPVHLVTMVAGTQPKLPMILFGMLTLLSVARDQPFAAGLFSMLSFLCWQPGLLFTGTAVLIFSGGLTQWRDLRGIKVLAGAAVPLALVVAYFCFAGSLSGLWSWTISFNLNVYAPKEMKGLRNAISLLWKITHQVFASAVILIPLGIAGLAGFAFGAAGKLKRAGALRYENLIPFSIVIPPVVYVSFCLINFQGGPDLIPLFPFVGIFAAWLIVEAGSWLAAIKINRFSFDFAKVIPGLAIIVFLVPLGSRAFIYHSEPGPTLEDQQQAFQSISETLSVDDRIYVHGTLEILVLLNRQNLNPFIMFDAGKDDLVAVRNYGGSFDAFLDELGAAAPKIISLSRLRHVAHGAEFERWVLQRYEELPISGYDDIYIRKSR